MLALIIAECQFPCQGKIRNKKPPSRAVASDRWGLGSPHRSIRFGPCGDGLGGVTRERVLLSEPARIPGVLETLADGGGGNQAGAGHVGL